MTCPTCLGKTTLTTRIVNLLESEAILKYLFIAALLSLLFLLLYSRLRPYLEFFHKMYRTLNADLTSGPTGSTTARTENKLVRCVACGTWVPADRLFGLTSGPSAYCSRDCLEKASPARKRKLAG